MSLRSMSAAGKWQTILQQQKQQQGQATFGQAFGARKKNPRSAHVSLGSMVERESQHEAVTLLERKSSGLLPAGADEKALLAPDLDSDLSELHLVHLVLGSLSQ